MYLCILVHLYTNTNEHIIYTFVYPDFPHIFDILNFQIILLKMHAVKLIHKSTTKLLAKIIFLFFHLKDDLTK